MDAVAAAVIIMAPKYLFNKIIHVHARVQTIINL